jgi:hypothetical protein
MFKIKARFLGKNSLGFVNGNIYNFNLVDFPHIKGLINITTDGKPCLRCEYSSWEKFIPNWEILNYENTTGDHDAEVHHTKVNNGLKSSLRDYRINKVLS